MSTLEDQLRNMKEEFSSKRVYRTRKEAEEVALDFHKDPSKIYPFRGGWAVKSYIPAFDTIRFSQEAREAFDRWRKEQPNLF